MPDKMRKFSDKIVFYLACACVFLPWFTWNAKVMGYCWGFDFILALAPPLFVTAFYLYARPHNIWLIALTELCAVLPIVTAILAVGYWQELRLMSSGWKFSLKPVLPGWWAALAMFVLLFGLVQFEIFRKPKYACSCCGYYTFDHEPDGSDNICPVCFWQDDYVQLHDPQYGGGANEPCLEQARLNYKEFGSCERRLIQYVRKPKWHERIP